MRNSSYWGKDKKQASFQVTYFLNALLQTSQGETQQVKIKMFQTAPLKPTAVERSQAELSVCKKGHKVSFQ